jgi:hypothetical protein
MITTYLFKRNPDGSIEWTGEHDRVGTHAGGLFLTVIGGRAPADPPVGRMTDAQWDAWANSVGEAGYKTLEPTRSPAPEVPRRAV